MNYELIENMVNRRKELENAYNEAFRNIIGFTTIKEDK